MPIPAEPACTPAPRQRDLILRPAAWLFWYAPALVWAVARGWPAWRARVWALAFAVMGTGCTLNALRCRRLHRHLTAPLFLLAAAWCVLAAHGAVALHPVAVMLLVGASFAAAVLATLARALPAGLIPRRRRVDFTGVGQRAKITLSLRRFPSCRCVVVPGWPRCAAC